jgi:hypothetical protein
MIGSGKGFYKWQVMVREPEMATYGGNYHYRQLVVGDPKIVRCG